MNKHVSSTQSKLLFDKSISLFDNFLQHTDQADNAVQHILATLKPSFPTKVGSDEKFAYLDVGSGSGVKTLAIAEQITKIGPIDVIALDPSQDSLARLKTDNPAISLETHCASWEDFQPDRPFDLITSIHTMYYMKDWEAAISKMLSCLVQGGTLFLSLRTLDEVCKFKNTFFPLLAKQVTVEPDFSMLVETLKSMGVRAELFTVPSSLSIQDFFDGKESGYQLIEFLLRTPYSAIAKDTQAAIEEYLEPYRDGAVLKQIDGFAYIVRDDQSC